MCSGAAKKTTEFYNIPWAHENVNLVRYFLVTFFSFFLQLLLHTKCFVGLTDELDVWLRFGSPAVMGFIEAILRTLLTNPHPYLDTIYEACCSSGMC